MKERNVNRKAKAGLCLLYEKWFNDYCNNPQNEEKGTELRHHIEHDSAAVIGELSPHFELVYADPIAAMPDALEAIRHFREEGVELLIVISLFWSGDKPLLKVLETFPHLPVLFWCYAPLLTLPDHMGMNDLFRAGGVVGALQTSAPLRKMGKTFSFVFGTPGDPALAADLAEYGRAFAARERMRGLRLGQLAGRYEEMTGTYADEFFLLSRFGIEKVYVSSARLFEAAANVTEADVDAYLAWLKEKVAAIHVSDDALRHAARASLAVAEAAREERLDAVALQDFEAELTALFKTRPQLWVPELDRLRIVPSMEGDVLASLALWAAAALGDTLPFYTEMFAFDQARNALLMGHAAMNCLDIAGDNPITAIPDAETGTLDATEGAWLHFKGKPGRVTVAGLFDTGGGRYRLTVFAGEAEYSDLLDTSPNVLVRVKPPLRDFYRTLITTGMTQHFALSYDVPVSQWEKFCEVTGIEFLYVG